MSVKQLYAPAEVFSRVIGAAGDRASVDAVEHRFAEARARLQQARSRLPQAEAVWSETLSEVNRAEIAFARSPVSRLAR